MPPQRRDCPDCRTLHPPYPRHHLLQKLEALRREIRKPPVDACESSARLPEALDEAEGDWISPGVEHDWNSLRSLLDRTRHRAADCVDQVDFLPFKIPCACSTAFRSPFPSRTWRMSCFPSSRPSSPRPCRSPSTAPEYGPPCRNDADAIDAGLLRCRGARSGEKAASHSAEERSSSGHWISVGPASSSASG